MINHGCLRLRHLADSLPAGHRRARGRRLRSSELGCGLPRLEGLEDRTLLASSPIVTTLAATGTTATGATLGGSVNPNGTSTDTSFQYSTSPSLSPNVVTTFAGTAGTAGSADGTGAAASFNGPAGTAVDPTTGNIYVADTGNDTIRMITPAGVVTTLAGTAGTAGSANGTGAAASFDDPTGVAYDPTTGDLFVADAGNDTIRMITSAGVATTFAGTAGTAGSTDGTGAAALFDDPTGVAVDPTTGNVYVADTGNDTIRMITPAGVVTTLAGTAGTVGSADGTGAAASFDGPTGVAYDPTTSDLFVADAGNDTIRMITSAGVVTTFAGTAGTVGSADGTGAAASFDGPDGVAVDPTTGNVYVADTGNDTIRMITSAGVVTTLAGTAGTVGSANGTGAAASFNGPRGVGFDPTTDTLFAADTGNDTIRSLSPPTAAGQAGLTGTTAQSVSAALTGLLPATTYYFRAVATSSAGTTDGNLLSFTTSATGAPIVTTQAATGITTTGATLNGSVNPNGTSTDTSFLYSTSPSLSPNVVTTFAGTAGTAGSADGTGTAASFNGPAGTAVDPTTGNIYVADTANDTIRMITPAGVVTTLAGTAGTVGSANGTGAAASFDDPTGVAYDPTTGDLFVADAGNDTIRMITSAGVATTFAGTAGTAGSTDGTGAAALFDDPTGVAVDPTTGNVYVADTGNDTIRMITPAGVVTTLAGTAGTVGSADGTGAAASFNGPDGVAVDAAGNVYVADTGNDTIRMITPLGVVTTLAGTAGTVGSADGTGAAASFNGPDGLTVDPTTGDLYVADTGNDTIRMITSAGVVTTLAGTAGTVGSANGTGTAASFNGARGVAFDPTTDTLFVADTGNDTIRSLSPPTVTAQTGLTGTTAQSVSAALTGLLPATTYYFQAVATSSAGTADGGILSFTTSAAIAPAVTTQAATSVAGTTATLNGTVNPEGLATTADFVYGTDPTLTTGTTTIPIPALTVGSGTSAVAVAEPLSGLLPNTTYYFQLEATNSTGTTDGGILSFTTTTSTVTTPVLTVSPATNVTTTGATVNGTVNPNGVATSVYFVYGTQSTLTSGTSDTAQQSIGSGTTAVPVTATLTGLTPGTTYYFEPAAISNGVTTLGPIQSFTTTTTGLSVTNLQRYGYHDQPTEFVLTFNEALNPTSAQDVNNYQIVPLVNGQPGSPIALSAAVYDSTNDTVTLMPVNLVYLYGQYQLTVTGTSPSGVSSSTGQFLSGAGPGQPGTNYVQSFGESILAGPNLDPPISKATRVRILRTWKHEEAMAAQIAARIDKAAEQRTAARTDKAAERRTAAASRADRAPAATTSPTLVVAAPVVATPVPSAVDAVLGNIFSAPEDQQDGAEQS